MIVDMPIGKFSSLIEEFNNEQLYDQVPVTIKNFGVTVIVPSGTAIINSFIKKFNLPTVEVKFNNGYVIRVANTHIFQRFGSDVFAKTLRVGDTVDHLTGSVHVVSIRKIESMDCYDISIDAPHVYYDTNGVLHHNTVMTAVLSDSVSQYGRSLVIVPNKSLVTQTEVDYVNMGLDVGVYFGDRKEYNRTHTICTWQSLNVLLKKAETQERNSSYRLLKDPDDISIYDMLDGVVAVIADECFDGNSQVLTPNGYIPIKDIKSGDMVINYSETTNQFKVDTVVKQHKNLTKSAGEKMYELEFDNGIKTQVTGNHKFLTDQGWVRADELTENHIIVNKA